MILIPVGTVLLSFFNLFYSLQPDSISMIEVHNATDSGDLVAVYSVMPGELQISPNLLTSPLPEDSSIWLAMPRMLYPVIIGVTSSGLSYRQVSFAAVDSSVLEFQRMHTEYGRLITKVYGSSKLFVSNSSPVQLVSISITDTTGLPGEILFPNIIFSGEGINIWLDPGYYNICITDNSSTIVNHSIFVDSSSIASLHLSSTDFLPENSVSYTIGAGNYITDIVSAVATDSLSALDLFNSNGMAIASYDIESPLGCWDKLSVQTEEPVSWLSAWDTEGRSYSIYAPDSLLNAYIFDLDCIDFDISFSNNEER